MVSCANTIGREYGNMTAIRALVLALMTVTAACRSGGEQPSGQVVAKGKDFEVTVAELDQLLRGAPRVSADQIVPTREAILNALIGQKLLASAALKQKLDQRPDTMQAIEAARRAVLAQAYSQQIAPINRPLSDQEIEIYYQRNTQLFAQRKVVTVDEITLPASVDGLDGYRALFTSGGMSALTDQLASDGFAVLRVNRQLFPDELPSANLNLLTELRIGDPLTYTTGNTVHMGVITAIDSQPISLHDARAMIIPRLTSQRRDEIIRSEIARLRADAGVVTFTKLLGAKATKK